MAITIPAAMLVERERQVGAEGYDTAHDDGHCDGELFAVATLYWQLATGVTLPMHEVLGERIPVGFPWDPEWWKPKNPRRDLERAGALCLAEIERLKRCGRPYAHVEDKLALMVQAYEGLTA